MVAIQCLLITLLVLKNIDTSLGYSLKTISRHLGSSSSKQLLTSIRLTSSRPCSALKAAIDIKDIEPNNIDCDDPANKEMCDLFEKKALALEKKEKLINQMKWWIPVVLLVIQNSGLILTMRYSRLKMVSTKNFYLASSAVATSEAIKFIAANVLSLKEDSQWNISKQLTLLKKEVIDNYKDMIKLCIPAFLYMIQNNLQYVATSNLSAPIFQVLYQMKILSSAIFSVLLLNRKLNIQQWLSMLVLTGGIGAVQYSQIATAAATSATTAAAFNMIGLSAVLCATGTSGLAGAVMEMLLKTAKHGVWMRSIQFSLVGMLISIAACMKDLPLITMNGFFQGFTPLVWSVVGLQALGGLTIALVVKNADNLVKGFATSLSILLSCVLSNLFFNDLIIHPMLFTGAAAVVGSTYWFSNPNFNWQDFKKQVKLLPGKIVAYTDKKMYETFVFWEQFDSNPVTEEGKQMRAERIKKEAEGSEDDSSIGMTGFFNPI